MDDFDSDVYWDLKDLNPDAIVYPEYHDAFIGFTLKNGKYVAVYDAMGIEEEIAKAYFDDQVFLDKTLKEFDGEVPKNDVAELLFRMAKAEAIKVAEKKLFEWDKQENAPVMFFIPKVAQEDEEEMFKYDPE